MPTMEVPPPDKPGTGDAITSEVSAFSVEGVQQFLETTGKDLVLNLVAAIVIFVVGKWIAKLTVRIVDRIAEKSRVDLTLRKFLSNLLYGVAMAFVLIAAINFRDLWSTVQQLLGRGKKKRA